MDKTFNYYQDPGHGWVAVKIKTLASIGLKPSDFTVYSFIKGQTVYLEEDGDASKFCSAWRSKFGNDPILINKHTNNRSPIRSYPRISHKAA